jgi:2-methylisocitrate lyase-like PEP mutase family enzyme
MPDSTSDGRLRARLDRREFFVAPGVFDLISAMLAERVGFDAVYASGYWLTASYLGLPDAGLATYTDMLDRVAKVCEKSSAPVIADADTGFGGLLNVQHTVRGYERVGVSAIQIEDQEFPKKCGHTPYRRVVPMDDMVAKVRVACDARSSRDFLVIARTDARTGYGLDEAIRRGQAYAAAGADVVFVESLQSEDEMRLACRSIDTPLMANMSDGGKTPIRSASELRGIGYACAIFPAMAALAASAAVERAMRNLKANGTSQSPDVPLFGFDDFCRMVGFEQVWAFEEKWKDVLDKGAAGATPSGATRVSAAGAPAGARAAGETTR